MKCVYFVEENSFPEVDKFLEYLVSEFKLDVIKLENDLNLTKTEFFKSSLKKLIKDHDLKAIYMGTRITDPYCGHLTEICESDYNKGWPRFTRVNPILYFSFENVWDFFHDLKVPYCSLYDTGYSIFK